MGFAVPAALGAGIAEPSREAARDRGRWRVPDDRDGAVDHGRSRACGPSFCLLNNGGYGMLEAIDRPAKLLSATELGLSRRWPCSGGQGRARDQARAELGEGFDVPRLARAPTSSRPSPPGTTSRPSWPAFALMSTPPSGFRPDSTIARRKARLDQTSIRSTHPPRRSRRNYNRRQAALTSPLVAYTT